MYSANGESWTRWLHEIRRIEFERTIAHVPLGRDTTVLELGCGDGFQLGLLRARYERVVAIDPEAFPETTGGFVRSAAEALPFPDGRFDLVISSNVIEHLNDRPRGLEEVRRVLRPGGYAAHIVPIRVWKFASLALNPLGYPFRVLEKLYDRRRLRRTVMETGKPPSQELPSPGILEVLGRWFYPPIHGTFPSHLAEFWYYGRKQWRKTFAVPGSRSVAEVPLLFYTQFGFFRFHGAPTRVWAARHGLASACAFISQKQS